MLFGRTRELELGRRALVPGAIVALVGPSGIGKSAIARELVAERENVVVVDCWGASAEELPARIAEAADDLAGTDVLLLEDWPSEVPLRSILAEFEGAILVTSQASPPDATALPVAGLDVVDAPAVVDSPAYALFAAEAERVRLGAMDGCAPEAIAEIVRRVGGHPLGIVLAAQHAASVGASEVAKLMREGIELRDDSRSPRQRSVELALRFSWDSLGFDNQRLFYLASRFQRPVRVTTLAELAQLDIAVALAKVRDLTQRGALSPGAFPRPTAVWRASALENFRTQHPDAAAELDDAIFAAALATASEDVNRRSVRDIDDAPSLWEAALDTEFERRAPADVGVVATALLNWSARFATQRYASSDFLAEVVEFSGSWRATVTRAHRLRRDRPKNRAVLTRALELAATDEELSQTYFHLALNAVVEPDPDRALELLQKSREHGGNYQGSMLSIALHLSRGEIDEARELLGELLEQEPPTEAHWVALRTYVVWAAHPDDRLREAKAMLALVGESSDQTKIVALQTLADVYEREHGDYDEARTSREQALELAREREYDRAMIGCTVDLAWGELVAGAVDDARRSLAAIEPSEAMYTETKLRLAVARTLVALVDEDLHRVRAEYRGIARLTTHVPSLRVELDVVDAAMALQLDDGAVPGGPLPELMAKVWADDGSQRDQLALYAEVEALRAETEWASRFARLWIDRFGPALFARLDAVAAADARLGLLADFSAMLVDGVWHHLPETTAAILGALASGELASFDTLKEAAWPGEVMDWDSLVNRVNVRISQLRGMGLKSDLIKTSDGFVLSCSCFVEPA